jgi:hypothetical protein
VEKWKRQKQKVENRKDKKSKQKKLKMLKPILENSNRIYKNIKLN